MWLAGYELCVCGSPLFWGLSVPCGQWDVPHMGLEDGPQGVGGGMKEVTCFPSAMTVAGTWDVNAAALFGDAMGVEQVRLCTMPFPA